MFSKFMSFAILSATLLMVGCSSSGTTYGTGISHEEQTLKSLYNLLSIQPDKPEVIDYSARPDLVMPANKQTLPPPSDSTTLADGQWPVNPEERIAEVRANAPVADDRSGALPVGSGGNKFVAIDRKKTDRDFYKGNKRHPTALDPFTNNASAEVRRKREQLAYSTTAKRKFLTEPPELYRTPVETAATNDLGVDDEVIKERRERARQVQEAINRGQPIPF